MVNLRALKDSCLESEPGGEDMGIENPKRISWRSRLARDSASVSVVNYRMLIGYWKIRPIAGMGLTHSRARQCRSHSTRIYVRRQPPGPLASL
jgi:hypothetical protein